MPGVDSAWVSGGMIVNRGGGRVQYLWRERAWISKIVNL